MISQFRDSYVAKVVLVALIVTVIGTVCPGLISAEEQDETEKTKAPVINEEKTPWLKGVTLPPVSNRPAPILPAKIFGGDGGPVPSTFTEDVPVLLSVDSAIFAESPPTEFKGNSFPKSEWTLLPSVRWFFDDVKKNKSTLASVSELLPMNQIYVTPLDPTSLGGVSAMISRQMKYEIAPGRFRKTFVNSSTALNVKVTDITPPTCGMEISVDGKTAAFWPIENPINKYPPPKLADVICKGALFTKDGKSTETVIPGLEMGSNMVVPADQAAIYLNKDDEIAFKVILQDNFKVNEPTVRFGICGIPVAEPVFIGPQNPEKLKLDSVKLPDDPHLFIEASDTSGNRQILFVPIKFK